MSIHKAYTVIFFTRAGAYRVGRTRWPRNLFCLSVTVISIDVNIRTGHHGIDKWFTRFTVQVYRCTYKSPASPILDTSVEADPGLGTRH